MSVYEDKQLTFVSFSLSLQIVATTQHTFSPNITLNQHTETEIVILYSVRSTPPPYSSKRGDEFFLSTLGFKQMRLQQHEPPNALQHNAFTVTHTIPNGL